MFCNTQPRKRRAVSSCDSNASLAVTEVPPQPGHALGLQQSRPVAVPIVDEEQLDAAAATPLGSDSDSEVMIRNSSSSSMMIRPTCPPHPPSSETQSGRFPCRICGKELSSSSNRSRHERSQHDVSLSAKGRGRGQKRSFAGAAATAAAAGAAESDHAAPTPVSTPSSSDVDSDSEKSEFDEPSTESSDSDSISEAAAGKSVSHSQDCSGHKSEVDEEMKEEAAAAQLELQQNAIYEKKVLEEMEHNRQMLKQLNRPLLLHDTTMQQAFFPFLTWLSQPPITSCEALVKARRVGSHTQLQPIKNNLRFIFSVLYEKQVVNEVAIDALAKPFVCKALYDAMIERQVGSSRLHVIFLLVKKMLVYLSSKESVEKRQFIQPSSIESYFYVENICADNSSKRKQESRNRAMHGVEGSKALTQSLGPQERFEIPSTWSPPAPSEAVKANSSNAASGQGVTMTREELQLLAQKCLSKLNSSQWKEEPSTHKSTAISRDMTFVAYLVTATLCLGLAPRSQVLKQLQVGASFEKNPEDDRYYVKILAEMSKNGKPVLFALPIELTPAYDLYLHVIRPRMLERSLRLTKPQCRHKYVFFKQNGQAPRAEFTSLTTTVTLRILGRAINAHAFRSAVITTYYQAGASQAEMDTLANIMCHDPSTARNFYFRPQFNQVALQANNKMSNILLHPPPQQPTAPVVAAAAAASTM